MGWTGKELSRIRVVATTGACLTTCKRAETLSSTPDARMPELRLSHLTADQRAAAQCATEVARQLRVLDGTMVVSVTPVQTGLPADSGGEWTVRFADELIFRELPGNSRDGGFTISVQVEPCRSIRVLAPG